MSAEKPFEYVHLKNQINNKSPSGANQENSKFCQGVCFKLLLMNLGILISIFCLMNYLILPSGEQRILNNKKEVAKSSVQVVHHLVQSFYMKYLLGELKEDQAKKMALTAVEDLRYNGNKYFWIHNQNFTMLMHPFQKNLNGQSLRDIHDLDGHLIFDEINQIIYKEKEGFYSVNLSNKDENFLPKFSFIKSFDEWGWIIGNGVSTDDYQVYLNDIKKQFYLGALLVCLGASLALIIANGIGRYSLILKSRRLAVQLVD